MTCKVRQKFGEPSRCNHSDSDTATTALLRFFPEIYNNVSNSFMVVSSEKKTSRLKFAVAAGDFNRFNCDIMLYASWLSGPSCYVTYNQDIYAFTHYGSCSFFQINHLLLFIVIMTMIWYHSCQTGCHWQFSSLELDCWWSWLIVGLLGLLSKADHPMIIFWSGCSSLSAYDIP